MRPVKSLKNQYLGINAQKGIDLESGPFPTQSLAREEALARIETLQS